jgi:hypothetical protein
LTGSVDDIVRMAIEDVFPEQTIPDQDNFLPDGTQHRAPDHSILDGKVLLERKSRNAVDDSQFYYKLQEIAKSQGAPFIGFGQMNLANIIKTLPNPAEANRKMVDFMLNQMMKTIRDAARQFEEHSKHIENAGQVRILAISDNSEIRSSNATDEYFVGRKMGGVDGTKDETGLIDAIILIKHPIHVIDEPNSYWFKCLLKKRLAPEDNEIVTRVSSALHHHIAHYATFFPEVKKVRAGYFRPLVV